MFIGLVYTGSMESSNFEVIQYLVDGKGVLKIQNILQRVLDRLRWLFLD